MDFDSSCRAAHDSLCGRRPRLRLKWSYQIAFSAGSVTGEAKRASFDFVGMQGVATGLVSAVCSEDVVWISSVASEGVGHKVLLEVRARGSTHAEGRGVGLGVGVTVGEGKH